MSGVDEACEFWRPLRTVGRANPTCDSPAVVHRFGRWLCSGHAQQLGAGFDTTGRPDERMSEGT